MSIHSLFVSIQQYALETNQTSSEVLKELKKYKKELTKVKPRLPLIEYIRTNVEKSSYESTAKSQVLSSPKEILEFLETNKEPIDSFYIKYKDGSFSVAGEGWSSHSPNHNQFMFNFFCNYL